MAVPAGAPLQRSPAPGQSVLIKLPTRSDDDRPAKAGAAAAATQDCLSRSLVIVPIIELAKTRLRSWHCRGNNTWRRCRPVKELVQFRSD
jgi:hypothetical protein